MTGTRAQLVETRRALIVTAVQQVQPDASDISVRTAIEAVLTTPAQLAILAFNVVPDPSVLTSGTSATYPVVNRFIEALQAHEIEGLVRAHCSLCPSTDLVRSRRPDGERLCRACRAMERRRPCPWCGQVRSLHAKALDGTRVCGDCGASMSHRSCRHCGNRLHNGEMTAGVCRGCAAHPPTSWQECTECGRTGPIAAVWVRGPMCPRCHEHLASLQRSIDRQLQRVTGEDLAVVLAYARWHVLPGARRRIAGGRSSASVCRAQLACHLRRPRDPVRRDLTHPTGAAPLQPGTHPDLLPIANPSQ